MHGRFLIHNSLDNPAAAAPCGAPRQQQQQQQRARAADDDDTTDGPPHQRLSLRLLLPRQMRLLLYNK